MANEHSEVYARPSRIPWPLVLFWSGVAGAIALGYTLPLPWPGVDDLASRVVGGSIGLAGVALLVWATLTMWHHRTTVLPHKPASALVTDGPYRYFRNPLYLAQAMIIMSVAEPTKNVWFVAGALFFAVGLNWLSILPEERHLEARFGDEWREYAKRTRRWL